MTKVIGRQFHFGIKKEAVRGTAETSAAFYIPRSTGQILPKGNYVDVNAGFGRIEKSIDGAVTQEWSEIEFEAPIYRESFGDVLLALFGSGTDAVVGGESVVYDHSYAVLNNISHPSFTLFGKDAIDTQKAALCMLNEFGIQFSYDDLVRYSASFLGKKVSTGVDTPTYLSDDSFFKPVDLTFKYATNKAGLAAAEGSVIRSFELNVNKNAEAIFGSGKASDEPDDIVNKVFEVTGSITKIYEDTSFRDLFLDSTQKAILASFVDLNTTIGTSSHPTITITLSKVRFTNWEIDRGLDDITEEKLEFEAQFSVTDGEAIIATLRNKTASY